MLRQVRAPVKHADVDEPRQCVERPVPAMRVYRAGEEVLDRRTEGIEWGDPAGSGELGRPDDIELQHVGIAHASVQPLDVELMSEVGCVRGGAQGDSDVWIRLPEPLELAAKNVSLTSDGASRDGEQGRRT